MTSTNGIPETALGQCGLFEERQVGSDRFNYFLDCPKSKTATIVLRGGSEQFVEEAHRSVHDALMVVKRTMASSKVVAGGGAIEMQVMRHLRQHANGIRGKQQLIINAYARALEIIPRQLSDNAGFDSTDILNRLRKKHFTEPEAGKWFGVDIENEGICDCFESAVWEPMANKLNAYRAATEAACMVLSVDQTVRNPKSEQAQQQQRGQMGGGRKGAPMSAAMGGGGLKGMAQMMGGALGGGAGMKSFKGRGGR
jgi:T-complex protein 1 subunit eta